MISAAGQPPSVDDSGVSGRGAAGSVPRGLGIAAAVGWRLLVLVAVLWVLWQGFNLLYGEVMSVAVAALLAALMSPAVNWLVRKGLHRTLATVLVLVGGLAALGAVLAVVINTLVAGLVGLSEQLVASFEQIHNWLIRGPLSLSQQQLNQVFQQLSETLRIDRGGLPTTALATTGTLLRFLGGVLLGLFTLFFFLRDGAKIWSFIVRVTMPASVRFRVHAAGQHGFSTLVAYVRATAAVAFLDAAGIGIGATVLGVPLPFVLAVLIFLGAFVPYVGAVVTGGLAVLVALAANGVVTALILMLIVICVMQLEGHVLQPMLLGRAVRLHPLAVVLSVTAGFTLAGVGGAVLAVPLVATVNTFIRALHAESHAVPEHGSNGHKQQ
ncbi:AI-2E family transporter [Saccharopolyspora phatthalungensis]|uniref:Putative PurR-regulated permease PerM n=1 Tax=Saccharopolyspora phatthalungensis TaxID=664693 RepID=A0A840PXE5_9PSEU|nr:AI-2E family transporter [Saccharopolyspora phatthalungensis]MBB5152594.1 putative PurR-regulated permease PerM [Saccharopolyspora phatthalungensis]